MECREIDGWLDLLVGIGGKVRVVEGDGDLGLGHGATLSTRR